MTEQMAVEAVLRPEEACRLLPLPLAKAGGPGGESRKPRIVLVDSATLNRQCVIQALQSVADDFDVAGVASCEDIGALSAQDVVLLNIHGSDLDDPWVGDAVATLRRRTDAPVILISSALEGRSALQALARGLRGVVPVTVDIGMLVAAVRLVVAGGTFLPNEILADCAIGAKPEETPDNVVFLGFTPREAEVLEKLKQGKINKIIAYELNISESTVKIHVRHIMRKLRASNRTEVVHRLQCREAKRHA
jgi:DNA-binding NarL/FixJ family response regulator